MRCLSDELQLRWSSQSEGGRPIRLLAIIATLAFGLAAPAAAQEYDPPATERFTGFTEEVLREAVEPLGASVTSQEVGGEPAFVVRSGESVFVVRLYACKPVTGCPGMLISKYYRAPEGVSRLDLLDRINAFNLKANFIKLVMSQDGQNVLATRYVISDHGGTYGNLRIEFQVLENLSGRMASEVLGLE